MKSMKTMPSTYSEILNRFFQVEKVWDYSLKNTADACRHFWNPEKSFKSIHIAGTNGKGSVSKMVFQILKDAGKRVGVYTSPHLIDIRERFETGDWLISKENFSRHAMRIIEYGGDLSYFERCAVLAFLYFREQWVEYAVIEVWLWGRLDATNVITPIISAITSIGYDHMEFLGETLEEIAYEKWGIIKPWIPVVLYAPNPTLEQIARERGAPVILPKIKRHETNLLWAHQESNAHIAYEIWKLIWIDEVTIEQALLHVHHPGRMQYLYPNLLVDWAHNEEWLRMLKLYLERIASDQKDIEIVYCFNLKSWKGAHLVTDTFPLVQEWYIVRGENPLLSDAEHLKDAIREQWRIAHIVTPQELLLQREKNKNKLFVVFGSLYLLGELLK